MIFGWGGTDCARSVAVASCVQTTKINGRTNFFKLPAFYFQPMREERKGGLVLPTKRLPNLTRPPVLSGCSRDVNTFFHLGIKKRALAEPTFLALSYRQEL